LGFLPYGGLSRQTALLYLLFGPSAGTYPAYYGHSFLLAAQPHIAVRVTTSKSIVVV